MKTQDSTPEEEGMLIASGVQTMSGAKIPRLVPVRGRLFDFCASFISIIVTIVVVFNYLVISNRVKIKNMPFGGSSKELEYSIDHQRNFIFPNAEISSHFDSGNARSIVQHTAYEFEVKVGGEANSHFRRWFYFSVHNIQQPVTLRFFVGNISMDYSLLETGVSPVYKSESSADIWSRLEEPTKIRKIGKDELEIEFSYQYDPSNDGKIWFALTYPASLKADQLFYSKLETAFGSHKTIFFEKQSLMKTKDGNSLEVVLLSSTLNINNKTTKAVQGINFPEISGNKTLVILTARIHGYETISSGVMRNIANYLLGDSQPCLELMDSFLFVLLPMLNPDGVSAGFNRADAWGNGYDLEFPISSANSSAEAFTVKSFLTAVSSQLKTTALLHLTSTLNSNFLKISVPLLSQAGIEQNLLYPYFLLQNVHSTKGSKSISVTDSNFLREMAVLMKNQIVVELNVPAIPSSELAKGQVTTTESGTVVKGFTAGQGSLGIHQISQKIINSFGQAMAARKFPEKLPPKPIEPLPAKNDTNTTKTPAVDTPVKKAEEPKVEKYTLEPKLVESLRELYKSVMDLNSGGK
jgi:hypothetical protein